MFSLIWLLLTWAAGRSRRLAIEPDVALREQRGEERRRRMPALERQAHAQGQRRQHPRQGIWQRGEVVVGAAGGHEPGTSRDGVELARLEAPVCERIEADQTES